MNNEPRDMWKSSKTLDQISKNPNGTYNGARALAAVSGLEAAEVEWMFHRMRYYMTRCNYSSGIARTKVLAEAKGRPWEK